MELIEEKPRAEIESKEKEPKISYHFFYSPHGTAKDFENLEKTFKESDIYAPEIYKWTPVLKSSLQSLSKGEITLDKMYEMFPDLRRSTARSCELKLINNSKKPILLVDVPLRDIELMKYQENINFLWREAIDNFLLGNFQESLPKFRSYIKNCAELLSKREAKIQENLKNQVKEFLQQNPEYAARKDLKVLIRLGGYHTKIYQDLAKTEADVSREFSQLPYIYWSLDEAKRRVSFDKEIDDLLIARGIIENFLDPYLSKLTDDNQKIARLARKLSSQLSLKDIEQISNHFGRDESTDIIEELEKCGIKIPKSEEEIDRMLE